MSGYRLTSEEVEELLTADNVQLNTIDNFDGSIEVAWEYILPDGTYKRWPAIVVAQFRANEKGIEYTPNENDQSDDYLELKSDALDDVAQALGYPNVYDYNDACRDNPWEVNQKLQALRD